MIKMQQRGYAAGTATGRYYALFSPLAPYEYHHSSVLTFTNHGGATLFG